MSPENEAGPPPGTGDGPLTPHTPDHQACTVEGSRPGPVDDAAAHASPAGYAVHLRLIKAWPWLRAGAHDDPDRGWFERRPLPDAGESIAEAHRVAAPDIRAARAAHGPLPPLNTEEWRAAPDLVKRATVLTAGLAWVTEDPRQEQRAAGRDASSDVHGGEGPRWRRHAETHVPYDEMRRRRSVPGPLARDRMAAP